MSKQAKRRRLAKLRSCLFDGQPLMILPSALQSIKAAIVSGDDREIQAALTFGGREVDTTMKIVNGIAIIPVTGILRDDVDFMVRWGYGSSYQLIERDFATAMSDSSVKGVLFFFATPGGNAVGCSRVGNAIFASRGVKPIRAYTQNVCCSAGYYIAAACDHIEATADARLGSIGAVCEHVEYSKMLAEEGITPTIFINTGSPKKADGNPLQKLTKQATDTLQNFAESYGSAFISDVAKYRGTTTANVLESYGQGDSFRADVAVKSGMVDSVVANFAESFKSISDAVSAESSVTKTDADETPIVTESAVVLPIAASLPLGSEVVIENLTPVVAGSFFTKEIDAMKVSKKIRAQLFALDLIDNPDVSDEICLSAMGAWFAARGGKSPADETAILNGLRDATPVKPVATPLTPATQPAAANVAEAHETEMGEARLADLRAAADLINGATGYAAVTADMVLDSFQKKLDAKGAMAAWNVSIAEREKAFPQSRVRVTGEGADRFAADAIDAMLYRASDNRTMELSAGASRLVNRPLWSIAADALRLSGRTDIDPSDAYSQREYIAEQAMQMGVPGQRHTFHSTNEDRRYIQASGAVPFARPGDFPNILSGLANKYLDTIQLDEDYSFPYVSALLPGGLNDFKPGLMVNKGIVEELDELMDAEDFKQLGLAEEVLSHIFLRRFGNKWGWTTVMIANDDMNAFAEGMLGLDEAWMVTQNRLVVDRYTSNEALLDGAALFANRANTGTGTNPALNNNIVTAGAAPSDAQWGAMENAYADIGGIATGRRVRGMLNTIYAPTGTVYQEARRTFAPLGELEPKAAATTANVGLYRGQISIVPESELRTSSAIIYYGLRSPTQLNTATVVRAYFNGYGTAGRRERWYDPENKTTWVSIEGRIAVAVKNWRYAVRNDGTGA